jgi:hypothetical protein
MVKRKLGALAARVARVGSDHSSGQTIAGWTHCSMPVVLWEKSLVTHTAHVYAFGVGSNTLPDICIHSNIA